MEPTRSLQLTNHKLELLFLQTPNRTLPLLLMIQEGDKNKNWDWSQDGVGKTAAEAIIAGKLLL